MSKTYRRDNNRGTQRREPYKKRIKNENLDRYKGYSSDDFEDDFDDVRNFEEEYDLGDY